MKFFIVVALALVACVAADVNELGYNYQQPAQSAPAPVQSFAPQQAPEQSYIPPAPQASAPVQHYSAPAPAPVEHYSAPAPAPVQHYSAPAPAPVQHYSAPAPAPAPVQHYSAPAPIQHYAPEPAPIAAASSDDGYSYNQPQADQGYRYKTVRRVVYRHRA